MAMMFNQSEESKAIKRLNERLKEIDRLTEPGQDNPLITRYSRELRESGIEFTKDKGTNRELGEKLSRLTAGRKYTERDSGAIFDIHGRIREEFNRIQRGELTAEEEARAKEREYVYGDYGYPID